MAARRQLYVLRHAKSSWDDPGLEDHDRPLAPRGRRAVQLIARHLLDSNIHPDQVLCSSARRAVETCEGVSPGGELVIERDLYLASSDGLLARLHQVPAGAGSVMLIGHNPALQMLVLELADPGDASSDLDAVDTKFPTGALATLAFDGPWSGLRPGSAKLESLLRPRDLG
jgi:phosphohistidine phosphatase